MTETPKKKPKVLTERELEKLKLSSTDLPGLIEYSHHVGGFKIVPTNEGHIRSTALKAVEQQATMQMEKIMEQMSLLAKQAQEIKDRVEISQKVYQARISFKPVMGQIYHLYERESGEQFLSNIAPDEWSKHQRDQLNHTASVELLGDQTWRVVAKGS